MVVIIAPSSESSHTRRVTESQRALELRRFFTPYLSHNKIYRESAFNESLNGDGALTAYAETIVWRLGGIHCMVSLVDRLEQYFIAGATRQYTQDGEEIVEESSSWFGCDTVPTPGGLCENTLSLDAANDPYPCFIINDLSRDVRFASLPVVDGSVAAYRFYAGTPIRTKHGVNIGSFFIFDKEPRDGLTLAQRKYLHGTAAKVMKHLETKREATERRRVVMMSKGISDFLTQAAEPITPEPPLTENGRCAGDKEDSSDTDPVDIQLTDAASDVNTLQSLQRGKDSVLDKIRLTLDRAAEVLLESLDLYAGGVVFLDTTIGYGNIENLDVSPLVQGRVNKLDEVNGQIPSTDHTEDKICGQLSSLPERNSDDRHKSAKIMAMSVAPGVTWDSNSTILNGKTLQPLIASYPKGNIWYLDDGDYFLPFEQINELATAAVSRSGRRRSTPNIDLTRQNSEATMLFQIFHKARQIMFLPLWDTSGARWYSGCFVWSQSAVPVFSMESELPYLAAFTNSVMVELSRLDAITSNKMKSDFISSISHELRSPLHGILASADFLRESELDASQAEFISTIQNCSGTLLDTINHVLDYSKINSFENTGDQQGSISNELYQVTNLALLCEDLINGMMAAGEFRGADTSIPVSNEVQKTPRNLPQSAVEIILDIQSYDWEFKVQSGALRRVIMNIFGNAQKYTNSGYIWVEVRIQKEPRDILELSTKTSRDVLMIRIRDTGRGMSSEYMKRKLYHPFAQEDSFAPGVGLGLSIVWSIVNQLGGKIQIRSEIGKGTDVEITLPVDRPDGSEVASRPDELNKPSADTQEVISSLRERVGGNTVMISRRTKENTASRHNDVSWDCIERYCSDWFGYKVISCQENDNSIPVDLVITDHREDWADPDAEISDRQRVLVVHQHMIHRQHHKCQRTVGTICAPIGPFKLARSIISLLDQEILSRSPKQSTSDRGTQTPLASPVDRLTSNGMPMTDYGFMIPLTDSLPEVEESIESEVPKVSVDTSLPLGLSLQDEGINQVLASSGVMSIRMPARFSKQTQQSTQVYAISNHRTTNGVKPPTNPTVALHILAVDDNPLNLQLIHRYLLKRQIDTIVTAVNGVEAVAAVREAANQDKYFDVIFMDISMPEMDGFEATRLIRSFERSLAHRSVSEEINFLNPEAGNTMNDNEMGGIAMRAGRSRTANVIALTGLASRRDREEAQSSGFDDFLTKPIAFGKIGDLLRRLSEKKVGING